LNSFYYLTDTDYGQAHRLGQTTKKEIKT